LDITSSAEYQWWTSPLRGAKKKNRSRCTD